MSREQMEAVIRGGGSVLFNGRCLTRLDELPSELDMAQGEVDRQEAIVRGLDSQLADLRAKRGQAVRDLEEACQRRDALRGPAPESCTSQPEPEAPCADGGADDGNGDSGDGLSHAVPPGAIAAFVRECFVLAPGESVPVRELYVAWESWRRSRGLAGISEQRLGRLLRSAVPGLGDSRPRGEGGGRVRCYTGITLRPEEPPAA